MKFLFSDENTRIYEKKNEETLPTSWKTNEQTHANDVLYKIMYSFKKLATTIWEIKE